MDTDKQKTVLSLNKAAKTKHLIYKTGASALDKK